MSVPSLAVHPLGSPYAKGSGSDIGEVSYRNGVLRVTVDTIAVSGESITLEITFVGPRGFRLLDEGDLIPYWESGAFRSGHHLFEIIAGGWRQQETAHKGMLSVSDAIDAREWFVATTNGCMNVLSLQPPTVDPLR